MEPEVEVEGGGGRQGQAGGRGDRISPSVMSGRKDRMRKTA